MIEGHIDIREAYRGTAVAGEYLERRFRDPLGALLHRRQVAALRQLIRAIRARRVLEIAPGPARVTTDIVDLVPRGTFVDASMPMLDEARRRLRQTDARWSAVNADAFQLPLAGPFDLVYAFRFIRHFDDSDRIRLYREIARVLAPAGHVMFDVVNAVVSRPLRAGARPDEYRHYDALLTPGALEAELAKGALRLVSLEPVQRRYPLLRQLQMLIAPRSPALARAAIELVDRSGGAPLEWIATCRRA